MMVMRNLSLEGLLRGSVNREVAKSSARFPNAETSSESYSPELGTRESRVGIHRVSTH